MTVTGWPAYKIVKNSNNDSLTLFLGWDGQVIIKQCCVQLNNGEDTDKLMSLLTEDNVLVLYGISDMQ